MGQAVFLTFVIKFQDLKIYHQPRKRRKSLKSTAKLKKKKVKSEEIWFPPRRRFRIGTSWWPAIRNFLRRHVLPSQRSRPLHQLFYGARVRHEVRKPIITSHIFGDVIVILTASRSDVELAIHIRKLIAMVLPRLPWFYRQ